VELTNFDSSKSLRTKEIPVLPVAAGEKVRMG